MRTYWAEIAWWVLCIAVGAGFTVFLLRRGSRAARQWMDEKLKEFLTGLVGRALNNGRAKAGAVRLAAKALVPQMPALFAAIDGSPINPDAVREVFAGAAAILSGGEYVMPAAGVGGYTAAQLTGMAEDLAEVCAGTLETYTLPAPLTHAQAAELLGLVASLVLAAEAAA
jgi:hypothetical protein